MLQTSILAVLLIFSCSFHFWYSQGPLNLRMGRSCDQVLQRAHCSQDKSQKRLINFTRAVPPCFHTGRAATKTVVFWNFFRVQETASSCPCFHKNITGCKHMITLKLLLASNHSLQWKFDPENNIFSLQKAWLPYSWIEQMKCKTQAVMAINKWSHLHISAGVLHSKSYIRMTTRDKPRHVHPSKLWIL